MEYDPRGASVLQAESLEQQKQPCKQLQMSDVSFLALGLVRAGVEVAMVKIDARQSLIVSWKVR